MSGRALTLVIALATFSLGFLVADIRQDRVVKAEITPEASMDTYTATVEVESLRVISYLDDAGIEHPADSTLVPPVPLQGPREFTVGVGRRPGRAAPLAGRVGSP